MTLADKIRVQLYKWDMGAMRKAGIQFITRDEYETINQSYDSRATELDRDDWYGKKLPNVIDAQ